MNPDLAKIAALLSDPTRSAILLCLMDGTIHPSSELAYIAKVKPQTASFHLHKMLDADLVSVEKHGRHRYYKLKSSEVARVLEQLLHIAPKTAVNSLNEFREKSAIHLARTCYDHLAGYVGVQLTNALMQQGFLTKTDMNFDITAKGRIFLEELGIIEGNIRNSRRKFAPCCLDWTERQHHIAGALGNALLENLLEAGWFSRIPKTRALKVTPKGKLELKKRFSIQL
ncbi:MAG: helix-turn-helix domain-containing protein [Cytobacillus gottheilii]|uniref:ArsR/SmtB family transcription factor n=1 Tax=Cytobacillus gottheilii TaxID=859144 RepID=UPI0008312C71|nr:helix-turn-helix domain-containing protein [Cytobacillus gottheilii]